MFSHVMMGVTDLGRAYSFYAPLAEMLGLALHFHEPENGWAAWKAPGKERPLFIISIPFNGNPHSVGNGQMTAFECKTRAQVDQAYAVVMDNGATDEGKPGLRPHYHRNYYGAYFRDPDGNKLCVVCHAREE